MIVFMVRDARVPYESGGDPLELFSTRQAAEEFAADTEANGYGLWVDEWELDAAAPAAADPA